MEQGYIFIHNNIFPTLFAISSEEQSQGLMHQEWPPPVMSFVYDGPRINKFWMKNTPSPLDIIFCHGGRVSEICFGEPYSTSVIGSNLLSDLVIELPHGSAASASIKVGHEAGLVRPTEEDLHRIIATKYNHFVKF